MRTTKTASLLYVLIDHLEGIKKLVVVIAADRVCIGEVFVEIRQLHVRLLHTDAARRSVKEPFNRELNDRCETLSYEIDFKESLTIHTMR